MPVNSKQHQITSTLNNIMVVNTSTTTWIIKTLPVPVIEMEPAHSASIQAELEATELGPQMELPLRIIKPTYST
jgi:hypothetical protein